MVSSIDRLTFDLYDTNARYTASYVVTHMHILSLASDKVLQKRPVCSYIGNDPCLKLMVASGKKRGIVIKNLEISRQLS